MSQSRVLDTLRETGLLRDDGTDAWLELSTSGTADRPRTVIRTVESWTGSMDHVSRLTGTSADDRVLVPAPASSSMFAFARAHTAHLGADLVALARWSLRDAAAAAQECTVAHLTPSMLSGLTERTVGSLRVVVCAGAALPPTVRRSAEEAGVHVVDYYGATELSFVAMRSDGRMAAFPGVEIDLREGVVWARSPWLSQGYAAGHSGPYRRDPDGWATVGDHGRWDDDEGLVLTGRGDDVVSTGGTTVLCGDVEAVLHSQRGVVEAVVVGVPHPDLGEVLEAVVVAREALDVDGLRRACAGLLAPAHLPRRWHVWESLPTTSAGKVDRATVRDRVVAARRDRGPA